MQVNELFDAAFSTYRTIGKTILAETIFGAFFATAGLTVFFSYLLPSLTKSNNAGNIRLEVIDSGIALALTFLLSAPLLVLGVAMCTSLVSPLTADFIVGNIPNVSHAKEFSKSRGWTTVLLILRQLLVAGAGLFIAFLLTALSAFVNDAFPSETNGSVVAVIVAILAVVGWAVGGILFVGCFSMYALAIPCGLIEDLTIRDAFKRSRYLMRTVPPHPSGYGALVGLIGLIFFIGFILSLSFYVLYELVIPLVPSQIIVMDFPRTLFAALPTLIAVWLVIPFWGIATTILYFERRVRLEGYDVEVLAQYVWRSNKGARFDI